MIDILNYSHIKGSTGEVIVKHMIESSCDIKIIKNILLPRKYEKHTEVDLIGLNRKGIFVLEVKNISGHVFNDYNYDNVWYLKYDLNLL